MLNVPLYRALVEVLGKGIQILKEDHPGSYVCPPVKRTRMGMKAKRPPRVQRTHSQARERGPRRSQSCIET